MINRTTVCLLVHSIISNSNVIWLQGWRPSGTIEWDKFTLFTQTKENIFEITCRVLRASLTLKLLCYSLTRYSPGIFCQNRERNLQTRAVVTLLFYQNVHSSQSCTYPWVVYLWTVINTSHVNYRFKNALIFLDFSFKYLLFYIYFLNLRIWKILKYTIFQLNTVSPPIQGFKKALVEFEIV